jgi:phenylalanyl-tRNA synthetase beta chain
LTEEDVITDLPQEKELIAGILTGIWQVHPWQQVKVSVDFFVAKGIIESLLDKLGIESVVFEAAQLDGYHPGRTAVVKCGEMTIGFIGQIHPQLQRSLDIDASFAFELSLDALLDILPSDFSYTPLPRFPSIQRDLAVVVEQGVISGELSTTIMEVGAPLLKSVQLFDVYVGDRVEAGKKSLAFSLLYQDPERTLTDEDVQKVHDRIVEALTNNWNAELRK